MPVDTPILPDLRMELPAPDVERPLDTATLLADRVRLGILALLRSGPHCVCEMAAALDVRENNLSNHLARLREAGLVRAARAAGDSRRVYYERDEVAVADAIGTLVGAIR